MARTIAITDNLHTIQITYTQDYPVLDSATDNINKEQIVDITMDTDDSVCIIVEDHKRGSIRLPYEQVTTPTVVSGADLYAKVMTYWLNMPANNIFVDAPVNFTNTTLVDHIATWNLPIVHAYATRNVFVIVKDNLGNIVNVNIQVVDDANITVGDFGGAITGTWTYVLIAIV